MTHPLSSPKETYLGRWIDPEGVMVLHLWDKNIERLGQPPTLYIEFMDWGFTESRTSPLIFQEELKLPAGMPTDSVETFRYILEVLSTCEDESDTKFFWNYTPRQIEWRDERARILRDFVWYWQDEGKNPGILEIAEEKA